MRSDTEPRDRVRSSDDRTARPLRKGAQILDPLDRVPEIIFGVLMAVSFTGSISVATSGEAEIHTMIIAAFGCNIAWGLTDAVMHLLGIATERHRKINLLRQLGRTEDLRAAHSLIAEALPEGFAEAATADVLETFRQRLLAMGVPRGLLGLRDFRAAVAIFLLVVLATFPVVVPFLLLSDPTYALRISNALALTTLFICGYLLGKHAGASRWQYGLALSGLGIGLMAAIIALGG